ncbi:MAG: undecaprenyl-diphosphatase, partial [Treponema sp.]|nr:undecaprenyl-diphosphatase [Treponema sp.]
FVTAFVSGYAALSLLMKLINRGKLAWFAVYLIPLGIFGLIYF